MVLVRLVLQLVTWQAVHLVAVQAGDEDAGDAGRPHVRRVQQRTLRVLAAVEQQARPRGAHRQAELAPAKQKGVCSQPPLGLRLGRLRGRGTAAWRQPIRMACMEPNGIRHGSVTTRRCSRLVWSTGGDMQVSY